MIDVSNQMFDDDDDDELKTKKSHKQKFDFQINPKHAKRVKEICANEHVALMEVYDYKQDEKNRVNIDLKPTTTVRPYQAAALSKIFGNGRARSGVIVLPCGAGKSLTGIAAAATIKHNTLVLCTSSYSVDQWCSQFKLWTTIEDSSLSRLTAQNKDDLPEAGITISTYTMIRESKKSAEETKKLLEKVRSREWGLLLLDEVHVVPAKQFEQVILNVSAHCKLGLTATLLREDDKIDHLNHLIGPKMYEANWQELQRAGFLANVQCAQVWCEMTSEFFAEYIRSTTDKRVQETLWTMNPTKFRYCQYLVKYHEARGDKIIIFADNLCALKRYADILKRESIDGSVHEAERKRILSTFQFDANCNCIILSKVGDTSIDIPAANVIIQVSSQYGSRRQEAQRLGRILRPKARSDNEFNAFFYSLISKVKFMKLKLIIF
eukprot:TRINITY_DN472_c0_g1_i2.p1 TRINITY_DN472_c0_g1~~TRINITY_DN472_c0_g1_i2.p1  ORF type:complete len:436 (-),score=163.09 TRINITY_DN472_c0_g1_i2:353-1660(-)